MKIKRIFNEGFVDGHLLIFIVIAILVIGVAGYRVVSDQSKSKLNASTTSQSTLPSTTNNAQYSSKAKIAAVNATATGGAAISVSLPSTYNSPPQSSGGNTSSNSNTSNATNNGSSAGNTQSGTVTKPSSPKTYVVNGTFMRAPTSPVCAYNKPCSAPIADHTVVVSTYCYPVETSSCKSNFVARTTTNTQGQFSFNLPTGHYTLSLDPAVGVAGQTWSFEEIGQPLQLILTAKSGIE
jgi:hypothetical protein